MNESFCGVIELKSVGERLRIARERNNLKQTQVRHRTGINNKTLSGYERGISEPDFETLKLLAELYDVSVDWLLGVTDDPSQKITKDQAKNVVMEKYSRLPPDKKKVIDDLIDMLEQQQ